MKHLVLAAALLGLIASSCQTTEQELTSLELQALQTRTFDVPKDVAFRSVVSVFQDKGYTIDAADLDTGLITASSTTKTGFNPLAGNVMKCARGTATVEEFPNGKTRVRVNFVNAQESSGAYGQKSRSDEPILDQETYNNFFAKVEEAVFLRSSTK